ncbi:MAG: hypothetical protein CMP49_06585 [Flavobacteriales bacterium]|nr:hypothetical protein [Flavobacteriales bacterium]|tara:strand:- start:804 stop:1580 length:777 start_codon:yes stop_codon:yes gene_type:complete
MRKILILILFFYSSYLVTANNSDSIFHSSNNLYSSNQFVKAIEGYKSIVNTDIDNFTLYYNIGNCYYRLNKLGYSRLYYEKAKVLRPKDADVNHNIAVVKTQLIDDIEDVPKFIISRMVSAIESYFNSSQWGIVFVSLLYLSLILFIFFLNSTSFEKRLHSFRALLVSVPLFLIALCFTIYSNSFVANNEAVLVEPNAYVKTAPTESSEDYFIIHEGVKFKIIDKLDTWSRISLSDGKDGWIKTTDFEYIQENLNKRL